MRKILVIVPFVMSQDNLLLRQQQLGGLEFGPDGACRHNPNGTGALPPARLRAYPTFAVYADVYFQALTAMLEGMVQEFKNRDPRATNLDQYMTYAAHSVGTNLGLTASLVLLADGSLTGRLDQLWMTFSIVAAIIRYSNDIRSYERELAEGKFSSLQLAAKKFGIALDEVHFNQHDILRIIRAMMIAEVYDLRDCLGYLESEGGRFETVVINTVLGVVCLYEQADFHTLVLDAARS